MKIAYILPNYCLINGSAGGVVVQALEWAEMMKKKGHEVEQISVWGDYNWNSFDVIHFFYFGFSFLPFYVFLKSRATQAKFVCSPILDPHAPIWVYKILSHLAIPKLKIWNEFSLLRKYRHLFECFFARSEYEKMYLSKAFGINEKKIRIIPLASRFNVMENVTEKEIFCLHISRISDSTKNVFRLVDAAIKYDFKLVLVGNSTIDFNQRLLKKIGANENIKILGRVSDEKLKDLYSRAKVFALPSIREGVGLVALEAASYGCDIVITNIGGPKEYFLPNAIAVNPYSVDDIGKAIKEFLEGKTFQPELKKSIMNYYSEQKVSEHLNEAYTSL